MKRAIMFYIAVGIQLLTTIAQATAYQEKVFRMERGEYANQIDEDIQKRIEADLGQGDLKWEVTTLAHSSTASHRLLELKQGGIRVTVSIQYLSTVDDATRHLQYRLHMISMPRFKPIKGLGEEGYVLSEKGPIWCRVGKIVLEVTSSDGLIDTQRTVAGRIVSSANAA